MPVNRIIHSSLALLLCVNALVFAQLEVIEFREDPLNMKAVVYPEKDMNADTCAIIRIESNITGRVVITGVTVYKTNQVASGIIEHYIGYRERYLTLAASGFMPIRYKTPMELNKGKVYILRLQSPGGGGSNIQESAEIRLMYSSISGEEIYGGLDGDFNKIDFSPGERILKPSPGTRTIRLYSKGRIWEKRFELQAGQMITEQVEFPDEHGPDTVKIDQPGSIDIKSDPQGATVYLNRVEQGVTPLTLNEIQPGRYNIETLKDLYLPDNQVVEVKSLYYSKLDITLIPNFGSLEITSDPSDAKVWINEQYRGVTIPPRGFEIPQINAGIYSLRLERDSYYKEEDEFEIKPDEKYRKSYSLRPQFGSLNLTSEPSGAEVEAQGISWGPTTVIRDTVPSGEYLFKLKLINYFDEDVKIQVNDGKKVNRNILLRPSVGWLSIVSTPSDAKVTVIETKKVLGNTPIQDLPLQPGNYSLLVEKEGYEPYETAIPLAYGDKKIDEPELKKSIGHLNVSSTPPGANIYLNDQYQGTTNTYIDSLPTGNYSIRLEKKGFDPHAGRIEIKRNEVYNYTHSLKDTLTGERNKKKMKTLLISAFAPGMGQTIASKQTTKGLLYLAGFAGASYMAYNNYSKYNDAEDFYNTALMNYQNATYQPMIDAEFARMQAAYDKMESYEQQHKMFLMAAGGIWAWNMIDALIWGGGKVETYADSQNAGRKIELVCFPIKLGITVKF